MLGAQREIDILSLSNVMDRQNMDYKLGGILKRTGEMFKLWQRDGILLDSRSSGCCCLELNGDQLPNGASQKTRNG